MPAFVGYSVSDNAYGVLSSSVLPGDTNIILKSQENLPASNFILTWIVFDVDGITVLKKEKILVATRNNLTLQNVTRGFDGTIAQNWSEDEVLHLYVERKVIQDLQNNKLNIVHTIPNGGNYEVAITNNDTTNNPNTLSVYNNAKGRAFQAVGNDNPNGNETVLLQNTYSGFSKTVLAVQTSVAGGGNFYLAKFACSNGAEDQFTIAGNGTVTAYGNVISTAGYLQLHKDTGYNIRTDYTGSGDLQFQDRNTLNVHFTLKRATGYIGVGHSSPLGLIDLGTGASMMKLLVYGGGTAAAAYGFGVGSYSFRSFVGTSSSQNHFERGTRDGSSVFTERMRLTSTGNLYINKTSGAYNLEVSGTAMATTLRTDAGDTFTGSTLSLVSGSYPRILSSQSNVPLYLGASNITSGNAVVFYKSDASSSSNYLFSVDVNKNPAFYNLVNPGSVATSFTGVGPTGSRTTIQKRVPITDGAGNSYFIPAF